MSRIASLLVVAGFFLWIVFPATLHNNGFCLSKFEYLSDQEKIEKAISMVEPDKSMKTVSVYSLRLNTSKKYGVVDIDYSMTDFYKENPSCCKFVGKNFFWVDEGYLQPADFIYTKLFKFFDIVTIGYPVFYADDENNIHRMRMQQSFSINSCGDVHRLKHPLPLVQEDVYLDRINYTEDFEALRSIENHPTVMPKPKGE